MRLVNDPQAMSAALQAAADIEVSGADQRRQSGSIWLDAGQQFYVAHALATALQQRGRVFKQCAVKETDVDMPCERVDVAEGRIVDAGHGTAIVHEFPHIGTALSH